MRWKAAAARTKAKASPPAASPCPSVTISGCRPTAPSDPSSDELLGGLALHLFTRDPSRYLFGVYGSYHTWDRINIWRAALEGELYIGPVTLEGIAGYESLDVPSFVDGQAVLSLDDNHLFGQADVGYYITDDFKIYAGYRYINETSFGAAGTEYLIRGLEVPVALFARGDFGDEFVQNVTGGVRIYLSDDPDKSLIDRHRKDDPKVYAPTFPTLAVATDASQKPMPQCSIAAFNQVTGHPPTATASAPLAPTRPARSRSSAAAAATTAQTFSFDRAGRNGLATLVR